MMCENIRTSELRVGLVTSVIVPKFPYVVSNFWSVSRLSCLYTKLVSICRERIGEVEYVGQRLSSTKCFMLSSLLCVFG